MSNRVASIDLGRWVFAFCVVCLHVPMWHVLYLMPLNRCAVPFFYMVTGYFLANKEKIAIKLTARNYMILWARYSIILLIAALIADFFICGNVKAWTFHDSLALFTTGNCPFIDERVYDGKTYGFSTLWYLYIGSIALYLLYIARELLNKKWFLCIVLMLALSGPFINLFNASYGDSYRLIIQAIPYITIGYWINKNTLMNNNVSTYYLFILVGVLYVLGIGEIYVLKLCGIHIQDVYFTTMFLSVLIFITLLKIEWGGQIKLNPNTTMDIYVWHRLVYFIMVVLDCAFAPFSAIVVFITTGALAMVFRKIIAMR